MRNHLISAALLAGAGAFGGEGVAGQSAPAAAPEPELYLPDIVSTADYDLNAAFSPDGRTLLFTRSAFGHWWMTVFVTERSGTGWSDPEVASFSGRYSDADAIYHPDGSAVFFISDRPTGPDDEALDFNIWRAPVTPAGFGEPEPLPAPITGPGAEYFPSLTREGVLYFSAARRGQDWGYDLYRASPDGAGYAEPELLPATVNGPGSEIDVVVDPAGRFLIFAAYGRDDGLGSGDLYMSSMTEEGWGQAVNLGAPVNSEAREYAPGLSADGEYLYFTSERTTVRKGETRLGAREWSRLMHGPGNGAGDVYRVRLAELPAFHRRGDSSNGSGPDSQLTPPVARSAALEDAAAVRVVARLYLDGILESDTTKLSRAFRPGTFFYGVPDGTFKTWRVQEWIDSRANKRLRPATAYQHRVVSVDVAGDAASAKVELLWPHMRFVDYLSFLRMDGEWRIVAKIWHEEPRR